LSEKPFRLRCETFTLAILEFLSQIVVSKEVGNFSEKYSALQNRPGRLVESINILPPSGVKSAHGIAAIATKLLLLLLSSDLF
jgi:hypothetical protein